MDAIPDVALATNPSQRLPCVVILDGSDSMKTDNAIGALNDGLKLFEAALKSDNTARQRVRVLLIRVGAPEGVEIVTPWVDAIDFHAPNIAASGATPLGQAVRQALDEIEQEKQRYKDNGITYNRPWLLIITDGEPTDHDWKNAAKECCAAEEAKKVVVFGVGVGSANMDQLAQFSEKREPLLMQGLEFGRFFQWLSDSASIGSIASTGDDVQMPFPGGWAVLPGN